MYRNAKADTLADDKAFELGKEYVRAYNTYTIAVGSYGLASTEAYQAFDNLLKVDKRIKRRNTYERRKASLGTKP